MPIHHNNVCDFAFVQYCLNLVYFTDCYEWLNCTIFIYVLILMETEIFCYSDKSIKLFLLMRSQVKPNI